MANTHIKTVLQLKRLIEDHVENLETFGFPEGMSAFKLAHKLAVLIEETDKDLFDLSPQAHPNYFSKPVDKMIKQEGFYLLSNETNLWGK